MIQDRPKNLTTTYSCFRTPLQEIRIESWKNFQEIVAGPQHRSWAFRGHADASWPLFSTLSRYLTSFNVHKKYWPQQEQRILRIFRRKAHLLLDHIPDENDSLQWLALMQHHGAPTRLLDFTWSPYVAAFFALERATKDAAIWALFPPGASNVKVRTIRASQKIEEGEIGPCVRGNYEKYFLYNEQAIVLIGEPDRMNQRLIAQSGTFAVPGLLDKPVEEIFPSNMMRKFVLATSQMRRQAMQELYNMNIKQDTLFPGLDGLARSMAYELESHWAFDPVTEEEYEGFYVE